MHTLLQMLYANAYSNPTIGNVSTSRNSAKCNVVNGHNFNIGSDITVDYGNLEGKQVLVRYAIKF